MKLQLPGIHSRLYGELSKNNRNHLIFGVEICKGREAKNMNIPTSEGNSSGCESGWTMYLDHSADNRHQLQKHGSTTTVGYDEDDEDLSMVSDASSGPPNFHEDDQHYSSFDHESGNNFTYGSSASQRARQEGKKMKKNKSQHGKDKQLCLPSYLDDTASSPIKHKAFPPGGAPEPQALGLSQGFSATKFKGKSALQNHFSFFRSSNSREPASGTAGDLQGGNWK